MFSQGHISLKSSIKYCRTGSCKPLNRSGLIPCVSFTARAWDWCTVPLKAGRGWGAEGECEWGREGGSRRWTSGVFAVCSWCGEVCVDQTGEEPNGQQSDIRGQEWAELAWDSFEGELGALLKSPFRPWKTWKTLLTSEDSRGLGVLNRDTLFVCLLFVGIQKV